MLCIFSLKREESFLFLTLCCPLFCQGVKHKELMPELLTANYPATVYPLPGPRQADVELMQSPVSFDFAPQLMHFKQPPFQPKYFTIFNTSSAGRLEKFAHYYVVCFDLASCFRIIQITNTDPDGKNETVRRGQVEPTATTTTARGAAASTTTTVGTCLQSTRT